MIDLAVHVAFAELGVAELRVVHLREDAAPARLASGLWRPPRSAAGSQAYAVGRRDTASIFTCTSRSGAAHRMLGLAAANFLLITKSCIIITTSLKLLNLSTIFYVLSHSVLDLLTR